MTGANMAMSVSAASLKDSVGVSVLKKALDTASGEAGKLLQSLEATMSLDPAVGNNLDVGA